MKYKITFEGAGGTVYSYIDFDYDEEYFMEEGEWEDPFPNEENNSTAFGLVECILQSDNCPRNFHTEKIIKVKVKKIKE